MMLWLMGAAALAGSALYFDGVDDRVAMGRASELGLAELTVECWFRWDGGGETASTGVGGVVAYPLVAKGRGESDGGTQDMAYFLGLTEDGRLAADFEQLYTGLNHPVFGWTEIEPGGWHHAAASYDGDAWTLYLDGVVDGRALTGDAPNRWDSAQHFGVGAALNTAGTPSGAFHGVIDEVRVWSVVRGVDEIRQGLRGPVGPTIGLVARWDFDEGKHTTAHDLIGGVDGSISGASWTEGCPFEEDLPPHPPVALSPLDGAVASSSSVTLEVVAEDPEGETLDVRFYGRVATAREPFTIVALPDTQYYTCECRGGELETFIAQVDWIVANREAWNIAFVTHLGDLTDHGDAVEQEWINADVALSPLEDPVVTGLSDGIPYGIAVGNHDQAQGGADGPTVLYNTWFGTDRFSGRSWYGGHLGADADDHYELFSAGSYDFVVIHLEYDASAAPEAIEWAGVVLGQYPERRGIVVTHYTLYSDGQFSTQGAALADALDVHPNLFLMLGGHITGEARRSYWRGGAPLHALLADYQFWDDGGDGWMRLLRFVPDEDVVEVFTWSPTRGEFETDDDSQFALPLSMSRDGLEPLGGGPIASGDVARLTWEGLEPGVTYEWAVEATDGHLTRSPIWSFTAGEDPQVDTGVDDTGETEADDECDGDTEQARCGCASGSRGAGVGYLLALGVLFGWRRRPPGVDGWCPTRGPSRGRRRARRGRPRGNRRACGRFPGWRPRRRRERVSRGTRTPPP